MRWLFRILLLLVFIVQSSNGRAGSTDTLYLRTDSTVNVRLYFIIQTLLVKSDHPPKTKYAGQSLVLDSSEASSFFEVSYLPKLNGRVAKISVQRQESGYKFAPVNPAGKTPFWFTDTEARKYLPDSDFVYLDDFIVNGHTYVNYCVIKYVAANSAFDNSFCNYRNGITTAISNGLQSGSLGAFRFSFRDSAMAGLNGNLFGGNGEMFSFKLQFAEIRNAIYEKASVSDENIENSQRYWGYGQPILDSFYAFVFRSEVIGAKITPDLNSLLALGPMRKKVDANGSKLYNPFLVDYRQLYVALNPLQCQVVEHAVHDDFQSDVVWRLSESIYRISPKNDTALGRIMNEIISAAILFKGGISYFDPEFRIRMSLHENDSLLQNPGNVVAINVVRYWYRTDSKQYMNQDYVLGIGPVVKDASGNNKTLCYWRYDMTLLRAIGQKDYELLGEIINSKTVYGSATMHVEQDSLLSNGGFVRPVNLFDSYKNGDTLKFTYMVMNDDPAEKWPMDVYIVSIGNYKSRPQVTSSVLLPVYVGTFAPMSGMMGTANSQLPGYTGTLPMPYGFGYMDTSGVMIIPPQFPSAALFSESRARVSDYVYESDANNSGFKYGFIDSTGKLIGEYKYDDARDFHEGRAAVASGYVRIQKWGFVDAQAKEVIPCQYLEVHDFKNGYAAVKDSAGWFYIDKNGKPLTGKRYSFVHDFENGTAVVTNRKKWEHHSGVIDMKGNEIVPLAYDTIGPLSDGFRLVHQDSLYGFINDKGKIKLPMKYDGANSFLNGYASVSVNHQWGYIDSKGKVIMDYQYEWAGFYSEGLFAVKQNHKWGFADKRDSVQIEMKYDSVGVITGGRFPYMQNFTRTWGVSDTAQTIQFGTNSNWNQPLIDLQGNVAAPDYLGICFFNASGQQQGLHYYFINGQDFSASAGYFVVSARNMYLVVDRNGRRYFLPN